MSFSAFLFYFLTRFWAENWIASLTSRQLIFLIPSQNFNRELSLLRNNCHQHLKALCHCPEFYPVPLVVMRAGSNELNHFNYTQTWPQVTWHSLSQHSDTLCFTSLVFSTVCSLQIHSASVKSNFRLNAFKLWTNCLSVPIIQCNVGSVKNFKVDLR